MAAEGMAGSQWMKTEVASVIFLKLNVADARRAHEVVIEPQRSLDLTIAEPDPNQCTLFADVVWNVAISGLTP